MRRKFTSISYKLSFGLAISTILPLLIFCLFFYDNMRDSYRKQYIEQAQSSMAVSAQNISHYVSTCITSSQSVYYNNDVQELLYFGKPEDFPNIESNSSKQITSYMLSIYAATPDAAQIRLAAYRLNRSFLVTTSNLQRYIRTVNFSQEERQSLTKPYETSVQSIHRMDSYGHIVNYDLQRERGVSQYVFTIHLPIYMLPNSREVIGMLSIDIPISFIAQNCKYVSYAGEVNYVVDSVGNIIYSSDSAQIGRSISDPALWDTLRRHADGGKGAYVGSTDDLLLLKKSFDSSILDWRILKTVPTKSIYQNINLQLFMLLRIFSVCLIAAVIFNSISILRYTIPLKKATAFMDRINGRVDGALEIRLSDYVTYRRNDEIGVLLQTLESMLFSINDFTIRQYKLDIANKTAELKMLQAQINPHFIYNTLQSLGTRALKNHDREQYDYITALGQMMRYSMQTSQHLVPLKDELSHISRYVQLQKMRFHNNLSLQWEIAPESNEIVVPKMILQPLIENSFKHGKLMEKESGILILRAEVDGPLLRILVIDNGCPLTAERRGQLAVKLQNLRDRYALNFDSSVFRLNAKKPAQGRPLSSDESLEKEKARLYTTNNIGLGNVFLRLLLNFGPECGMELRANEFGGTTVLLTIPFRALWTPPNAEK